MCFRKPHRFGYRNGKINTRDREQTRRDEQAHTNAEAARAGVEKLADHRQRATADAWKSVEGSVDAASQGFRNASDQFARSLGYSGEEGERLARRSTQDVEAITKYGTVLAEAAQVSARQWYGLAQRQWQRNLEGLSQLARCRSVQDFVAVQSGLLRTCRKGGSCRRVPHKTAAPILAPIDA